MRIATSTLYASAISNMNASENTIAQLQQQISTGTRLTTPADDPVAAAAAVRVNQEIARNSDLTDNRKSVEASLNTVDTTLSSVNTLLTNVKSELVAAGNGAYSASDRKTLAAQMQSQLQDLLGYANTQDGSGEYLFSGYQTQTQPYPYGSFANATPIATNTGSATLTAGTNSLAGAFPGTGTLTITGYSPPTTPGAAPSFTYDVTGLGTANVSGALSTNGQVTVGGATFTLGGTPVNGDSFTLAPQPTQYQGDAGIRNVEVYPGRQMGTNLVGSQLFDSVPTGNGVFATSAGSANSGSGTISQGSVVSNAALTKDNYQVLFHGTGAVTAANTNTGSASVMANSISGTPASTDRFQLSFSTSGGTTTYDVLDTTSGASVSTAQPFTAGNPITVNGVQFTVNGTPAAGDNFAIGPGAASTYDVIDTTTNTTMPGGPLNYVSGNAIQVAGMSFAISGAPSAGDTFNVAPSSNASVFAIMQHAIDALNSAGSGAQANTVLANALSNANAGIDAAMARVSQGQTTVGGRLQELSALDSSSSQLAIQYKATLTQLTGVDMTSAISDLSQAQISLTAAQKSFVSVQNLSLFNYIQ